MKKSYLYLSLSFIIGTMCVSTAAQAGNIAVNGVDAYGQSMQAFTGVADQPSAIYYNPAGLMQLQGTQVQAGAQLLLPRQSYRRNSNDVKTHSKRLLVAPSFFLTDHHLKNVAFGIGLYAPFARQTKYNRNAAVNNITERAAIRRLDLVPTVSFNLSHWASVGFGLVGSRMDYYANMLGVKDRGTGYGYTGQAGVLFYLPRGVNLGITYRGPENTRVDGNGGTPGSESDFVMYFRFPGTISAGLSFHITPKWLASVQIDDELWSTLHKVTKRYDNASSNPAPSTTVDASDSLNGRLGFAYQMNQQNQFRFGYSYIEEAVPSPNIAPAQPDYSMHYVSVGYSYTHNHLRIDAGYEYNFMTGDNDGTSALAVYQGRYRAHVHIFMLGINYQF